MLVSVTVWYEANSDKSGVNESFSVSVGVVGVGVSVIEQ